MTDEEIRINLESLHASVHELYEAVQRHDGQLEQLIAAAKQDGAAIQQLIAAAKQDGAAIHQLTLIAQNVLASVQSLERTAKAHQERLDSHGERIQRLEDDK